MKLAANGLVNPASAEKAVVWYSYRPRDVAGTILRQWNIAKEVEPRKFVLVDEVESRRVAAALGRGQRVDREYRVVTPERVQGAVPTALIYWPR